MKLKKGYHTKFVILAAAAAWMIGAALAASGPVASTRPSVPVGHPTTASTSRSPLALVGRQAAATMPVPPPGITAGKFFKNVTALPDVSVADFMGTMGIMSASLSFCCNECHPGAGTDKVVWEQDTPRKRVARNMVKMVTAINKDNFAGRQVVTCWTCHRGSSWGSAQPPQVPDDFLVDSFLHRLKSAEALYLVFDERIALPVSRRPMPSFQVVETVASGPSTCASTIWA